MGSTPDKNLPTLIYLISAAGACPVVDSNKPAFYKSCIYNSLKGLQDNLKKVGPIFVFITAFATSKTLLLGFIRPKETNNNLIVKSCSYLFSALGNLGNVMTQKGRFAEAEWAFRKALNFRPNMADVHYNL